MSVFGSCLFLPTTADHRLASPIPRLLSNWDNSSLEEIECSGVSQHGSPSLRFAPNVSTSGIVNHIAATPVTQRSDLSFLLLIQPDRSCNVRIARKIECHTRVSVSSYQIRPDIKLESLIKLQPLENLPKSFLVSLSRLSHYFHSPSYSWTLSSQLFLVQVLSVDTVSLSSVSGTVDTTRTS